MFISASVGLLNADVCLWNAEGIAAPHPKSSRRNEPTVSNLLTISPTQTDTQTDTREIHIYEDPWRELVKNAGLVAGR